MWSYLVSSFGCAEWAAFFVAVLSAITSLVAGQHPKVAQALTAIADIVRSRFTKLPLLFLLGCSCFFSPARAEAGPIREWIRENRPGILIPKFAPRCQSCPGCQPGSGTAPAPAPISDPGLGVSPFPQSAAPVPHFSLPYIPAGGCPGGNCPAPQQRFVFPRK